MFHVGLRCANPTYESVDPYPAMGYNLYQFVVSAPIFALSDHQWEAAGSVAKKLLGEAIREDKHRRGAADEGESTSEDHSSILAAWVATAPVKWREAKNGDPDALRQTARNYLFGTGMPADPRKARLWLEAARLVEVDPLLEQPTVHPFWASMEGELNGILTAKERIRAGEDAMHWVRGLRQTQLRSLR